MPILVGLIVVTALVFYVLHMRAVAKDEAAAQRAPPKQQQQQQQPPALPRRSRKQRPLTLRPPIKGR